MRKCSIWLWETGVGHGEGIAAEDTVSRKVTLCDVVAFKQKWPPAETASGANQRTDSGNVIRPLCMSFLL